MKAKELCALLLTRGIKNLSEDEEEVVVDYLDDLGIEVEIDDPPNKICRTLMNHLMEQELGRTVPIGAYANSILSKQSNIKEDERRKKLEIAFKRNRETKEKELQNKRLELPGCVSEGKVFGNTLYNLKLDYDLGIENLSNGSQQYKAVVALPRNLFDQVYNSTNNPIIQLTTPIGHTTYVRVGDISSDNNIYINPLVTELLKMRGDEGVTMVKLCTSIPIVSNVEFTFYGDENHLNNILYNLQQKLPETINALSHLSLGLVLKTIINGEEVEVRVDKLFDVNGDEIFVGILPYGVSELKFEIVPSH